MLLTMCLCWKARQKRLGVDDFGMPLETDDGDDTSTIDEAPIVLSDETTELAGEETPLLRSESDVSLKSPADNSAKRKAWYSFL